MEILRASRSASGTVRIWRATNAQVRGTSRPRVGRLPFYDEVLVRNHLQPLLG
jgi:hypothetical protein